MNVGPGRATLLGPVAEPFVLPYGTGDAFQEVIAVPSPAVGANASYLISGAYITRLVAVSYRIVTSATVANRMPRVEVRDPDGVIVAFAYCSGAVAASLTVDASQFIDGGISNNSSTGTMMGPLFNLFIQPGYSVVINVLLMAAGDQLSRIRLVADRYPTRRSAPFVFEAN